MPLLAATSHRCAALGNMHRSEFESAPRERAMRKKQTPQSVPGTAAVATRVYLARTRGHLPVDIDRKLVGSIGTCGNYFVSAMLHLNQSKRLRYYIRRWIALSQQLQSRRCYYVVVVGATTNNSKQMKRCRDDYGTVSDAAFDAVPINQPLA